MNHSIRAADFEQHPVLTSTGSDGASPFVWLSLKVTSTECSDKLLNDASTLVSANLTVPLPCKIRAHIVMGKRAVTS